MTKKSYLKSLQQIHEVLVIEVEFHNNLTQVPNNSAVYWGLVAQLRYIEHKIARVSQELGIAQLKQAKMVT